MARYPQYLEAPLSVEQRDIFLHQLYAFVRHMRLANGVNERLTATYEQDLAPVFVFFKTRDVVVESPQAPEDDLEKRLRTRWEACKF